MNLVINRIKNPLVLAVLAGVMLTIIGSLIGWFSVSGTGSSLGKLVQNEVDDFAGSRQTAAIVISILVAILIFLRLLFSKRWPAIVAAVLLIVPLIIMVRQIGPSFSESGIELKLTFGYWLAVIGVIIQFGGSMAMAIMRVPSGNNIAPPVAPASAQTPISTQPPVMMRQPPSVPSAPAPQAEPPTPSAQQPNSQPPAPNNQQPPTNTPPQN